MIICGSCSDLNSFGFGTGNNISLTPDNTKAPPKYVIALPTFLPKKLKFAAKPA